MAYISAFSLGVVIAGLFFGVSFLCRGSLQRLLSARHEVGRLAQSHALRIGGVGIVIAVITGMCLHGSLVIDQGWVVFIVLLLAISAVGMIDDLRPLSWKVQIGAQVLSAIAVVIGGFSVTHISSFFGGVIEFEGLWVMLGPLITVLWIILIINAFNWCDGIDGLAGGVATIAYITLFVLVLRPEVYQPPFAIVAAICTGAVMIFTIFNLLTGRITLGTSGTYAIGFSLAILAILAGGKIGTTLLVLIVPLCDAIFVIWQRLREKVSPFYPDKRHLHHHLLARGWRQYQIVCFYYALTTVGAVIALATAHVHKVVLFGIYGVSLFLFLYSIARTRQHTV